MRFHKIRVISLRIFPNPCESYKGYVISWWKKRMQDCLRPANPQAFQVILFNINHVMKEMASGDREVNIASYAGPASP